MSRRCHHGSPRHGRAGLGPGPAPGPAPSPAPAARDRMRAAAEFLAPAASPVPPDRRPIPPFTQPVEAPRVARADEPIPRPVVAAGPASVDEGPADAQSPA